MEKFSRRWTTSIRKDVKALCNRRQQLLVCTSSKLAGKNGKRDTSSTALSTTTNLSHPAETGAKRKRGPMKTVHPFSRRFYFPHTPVSEIEI
jgi:hypothetical protein